MRDPVPSQVEPLAIIVAVLVAAIIAVPVIFALQDAPPRAHWRVTNSSVWGK